jgi:hypothetical protein
MVLIKDLRVADAVFVANARRDVPEMVETIEHMADTLRAVQAYLENEIDLRSLKIFVSDALASIA